MCTRISPKMGSASPKGRFLLFLLLAAAFTGCYMGQAPRQVPVSGFELLVQRGSQSPEPLLIAEDGSGCETFSEPLSTVCLLATNEQPDVIGGEAHGGLNEADTPPLTALIWRARIDDDASVCRRGGLLGERLARCEHAAQDPDYAVEQAALASRCRSAIKGNWAGGRADSVAAEFGASEPWVKPRRQDLHQRRRSATSS